MLERAAFSAEDKLAAANTEIAPTCAAVNALICVDESTVNCAAVTLDICAAVNAANWVVVSVEKSKPEIAVGDIAAMSAADTPLSVAPNASTCDALKDCI